MFKSLQAAAVVGALGLASLAVIACTAGTVNTGTNGSSGSSGSTEPKQQTEVTSPTGLKVSATISAATLGEECGDGSGFAAPAQGDCAADAGSDCGGPSSYCQQSNVQISFVAGPGTQNANVDIVSVTLHESASGNLVDTLTASKPQVWTTGGGYVAWDETIVPNASLKASYNLTAPKWSTIGSSSAKGTSLYSTSYRLHVTVRIDGVEFVLQSSDLNREPQVAT